MALMHVDFFSDVLGMCVNMDVILPRDSGRSVVCFGRVLLPFRPEIPGM